MIITFRFSRVLLPRALSTSSTISSFAAIFAMPSSSLGPTTEIPQLFNFFRFSATAGCLNIDSCIAGTTITGTPEPRAVVANEVTGVSSIPYAIFPIVFAVAGAIRRRSALPLSPQNSTCSTLPPSSVIAGFPVA